MSCRRFLVSDGNAFVRLDLKARPLAAFLAECDGHAIVVDVDAFTDLEIKVQGH